MSITPTPSNLLNQPKLTEQEVANAMEANNDNNFVRKVFPKTIRRFADPDISLQRIGLVSFTPAKGATPNEDGVFGYAKLRGNYATEREANERAEFIIREVDSYNKIFHTYVGRPFPVTQRSDYSKETSEVDIRKSMSESISSDVKSKKAEEQKTIKEIEEREKKLLAESKQEEEDPFERYITLRVKKAQVSWTYLETLKKVEEMKSVIIKTREDIEELDKEDKTYKERYFDKYMNARKEAGLSTEIGQENFIKFLVEDAPLDF